MRRRLVIIDVDHTVCDSRKLNHLLPAAWLRPGDYLPWCEGIKNTPDLPTCRGASRAVRQMLLNPENMVVFLTGRNDTIQAATEAWIASRLPFAAGAKVITRILGDMRPNPKFKGAEIAKLKRRFRPFETVVFDDDPDMVQVTYSPYRNVRFVQVVGRSWATIKHLLPTRSSDG